MRLRAPRPLGPHASPRSARIPHPFPGRERSRSCSPLTAHWGVLWGHCGPSAAFARSSSNLWQQVWEADGDIYWLSWLIICPARQPGELFGDSGELGEAVPDH